MMTKYSDGVGGEVTVSPTYPLPMAQANLGEYETVAASQTAQVLGATGAAGDFLRGILIIPANLNPGAVAIKDGNGTAITVFAGGTGSVTELCPIWVPLGIKAVATTTPGWQITTGASVSVIAIGDFT